MREGSSSLRNCRQATMLNQGDGCWSEPERQRRPRLTRRWRSGSDGIAQLIRAIRHQSFAGEIGISCFPAGVYPSGGSRLNSFGSSFSFHRNLSYVFVKSLFQRTTWTFTG